MKIHNEDFIFQPRKLEQENKIIGNTSGIDSTLTVVAVGKSSSTHRHDNFSMSAALEKKTAGNKGMSIVSLATVAPHVKPTMPSPLTSSLPT